MHGASYNVKLCNVCPWVGGLWVRGGVVSCGGFRKRSLEDGECCRSSWNVLAATMTVGIISVLFPWRVWVIALLSLRDWKQHNIVTWLGSNLIIMRLPCCRIEYIFIVSDSFEPVLTWRCGGICIKWSLYVVVMIELSWRVSALIGCYCYFQRRIRFYIFSALNILVKATDEPRTSSALIQRHMLNTLYNKSLPKIGRYFIYIQKATGVSLLWRRM